MPARIPVKIRDEDEHFNERFWNDSERWPNDTNVYTFLPRAFRELETILYSQSPLIPPPEGCGDTDGSESADEEATENYQAARIHRRHELMRNFIGYCRDGTLTCATRPKAGGKFKKLKQSIWNTEHCDHWFCFCDISLEAPYDSEDAKAFSDAKEWLFVSRASVAQLATSAGVKSPAQMSSDTVEKLITNAIHEAFIKYPEGDGGPNLDYEWIPPEHSAIITKAILLDLAANGYKVVKV